MIRSPTACLTALLVALPFFTGCSTMRFEARPNIPQPVIETIPVSVALFMPVEFSNYLYKGERYGFNWEVALGAAQSEGLSRLLTAMFEKVVRVDSVAAAQQAAPGIRAVLEPAVEEFSFVTPRDAGTQFYAVSIKYRVSVYTPDGRLAESWPFTGYGLVPATGMSAQKPLARATALAMRDAAAKLVVEFRDQAIIRGLLPQAPAPDTLAAPSAPQGVPPAAVSETVPATGEAPPGSATVPEQAPAGQATQFAETAPANS